jgi:hypothetical protein
MRAKQNFTDFLLESLHEQALCAVLSGMPNIKRLRLMFYLLAMIELVLVSGYYGWERLLLR